MTTNPPTDNQTALPPSNYFSANNIILAGANNKIENSSRCSVLNGANNYIDGKYNTHIIGDYIGYIGEDANEPAFEVQNNSFHVGCSNGLHVYGDITAFAGSANPISVSSLTPLVQTAALEARATLLENQVATLQTEMAAVVGSAALDVIWEHTGQSGVPILVDDVIFYTPRMGPNNYALYMCDLNGQVLRTLINSNEWPNGATSTTGPGYRGQLFADWENATAASITIYISHDGRVARFTYNRNNRTCGAVSPFCVGSGANYFGRDWYIYGIGAGANPDFLAGYAVKHSSSYNYINPIRIQHMAYSSGSGAEVIYNGSTQRYLGTTAEDGIVAEDGTRIYDVSSATLQSAGIGVNGNTAFYMYDSELSLMHRFLIAGNPTGNMVDALWENAHTSTSTTTAVIQHDQTFHIAGAINGGSYFYTPQVQFSDTGAETGISFTSITSDGQPRYCLSKIVGWRDEWGSGVQ